MPRKKPEAWFSRPQLVNLLFVPVITVVVGMTGWYFLTNDTLKRHETELGAIKAQFKENSGEDRKSRDETRKAFMENQLAVANVLSKLESRMSVTEAKQDMANQSLQKIADELTRIGRAAK